MEYAPEWKSTLGGLNAKNFKDAIDSAFIEGEERLATALNYFERSDLNLPATQQQFREFLNNNGVFFEEPIPKESINRIREGFNLLGRG